MGWLRKRWGDPGLRLVDLRFPDEYVLAHIPGSGNPDLPHALSGAARLGELLGEVGAGPGIQLVLLDGQAGILAARLFWMLECYGFHDACLLDGGIDAWKDSGLPLEGGPRPQPVGDYREPLVFDPGRRAAAPELRAAIEDPAAVILDVRNPDEYGRQIQMSGQFRAGHVPGALNLPWDETLLNPRGALKLLQPAWALSRLLRRRGIVPGRSVYVYCDTGMRSAHTYFVLRHLGYERVKLFEGGWVEWSRLDLPAQLGPRP
jgi:thiosulfate/3-mercaptopyruvate sulfurtransferase